MNTLSLDRYALEALRPYQTSANQSDPHKLRNAALSLAHHLRAHGLCATVGYGLSATANQGLAAPRPDQEEPITQITRLFISALDKACPITGQDARAKALTLKTEPVASYLLHSRLALPLADGFALAAKALWPTDEIAAQESTHA